MSGPLALVGGNEWNEGCTFDRELLEASGGQEVLVLPTAAAYEHPERSVQTATRWFATMGADVRGLMVLRRPDAEDPANVAAVREARFVYLGGGSPLHLRSVLKDSPMWQALLHAWDEGAVLAASSAGAMVLCDPMVDPRGGAFTLGLGLVNGLTVIPHANNWSPEKAKRTNQLAPADCAVVAIDEETALIRQPWGDGTPPAWRAAGAGKVTAWLEGEEVPLDRLPV
ncbi:MAG: Type 1 glutamine amidotransferase-like domain-containing protein [Actinobacteria bacterium]|nr:Type 1 glutamine amidotransferase-like domain-containing protein [Actinomycetota bacterium]MBW3650037.1 Type 1 glutamine amidotransferase-like domain-containing protein [Actinomycetota bacterium]